MQSLVSMAVMLLLISLRQFVRVQMKNGTILLLLNSFFISSSMRGAKYLAETFLCQLHVKLVNLFTTEEALQLLLQTLWHLLKLQINFTVFEVTWSHDPYLQYLSLQHSSIVLIDSIVFLFGMIKNPLLCDLTKPSLMYTLLRLCLIMFFSTHTLQRRKGPVDYQGKEQG